MKKGLGFAFWKPGAGVSGLPPTEGTSYVWTFQSGTPGNRTLTITNPNDVTMAITWVEFPTVAFTGPIPAAFTIPAHSFKNFSVAYNGTVTDDNTTGTYNSGAGATALAGEAVGT